MFFVCVCLHVDQQSPHTYSCTYIEAPKHTCMNPHTCTHKRPCFCACTPAATTQIICKRHQAMPTSLPANTIHTHIQGLASALHLSVDNAHLQVSPGNNNQLVNILPFEDSILPRAQAFASLAQSYKSNVVKVMHPALSQYNLFAWQDWLRLSRRCSSIMSCR
jgi:hypothetical protein